MTKKTPRLKQSHRPSRTASSKAVSARSPEKKDRPITVQRRTPRATPSHPTIQDNDLVRTLMDNMTDRIYFKDRESRFLLVNRSTASFLGLSDPSQAVGKTDFDFFSEEHAHQAFRDEQQIVASGQPLVGFEEKETWPDGHETWVSTTKVPLRGRAERIIGTFGISRDITDQKAFQLSLLKANQELEKTNRSLQAEMAERIHTDETLAHERKLLRTLMDHTPDRIYFKDQECRFLLVNRAQAEKFGLREPSDAVGKADSDYLSEEHARQAYSDEQKIIASGKSLIGIEEKETWPDGRETWVSSSKLPFRGPGGEIIGIFGISRDITDYKAAEEVRIRAMVLREANVELEKINSALQAEIGERKRVEALLAHERDLFYTMMDNTTDRIYFKDRESRFLRINRSLARHFGIGDPAEADGKRDFDFFSEEHAREAYTDEQKLVNSEQPFVGKEEKETWPDGHSTWVSTTKFPMRDQKGSIIGTFGISRDITERKIIELSILQANQELEKTNQALQSEISERSRAESELAHEQDLFRTMMDSTTDQIYFKDANGRFLLVNRSLADHLKLDDPSMAVGKSAPDYFTEDHARQEAAAEQQILADGKPILDIEIKETRPDGNEAWISVSKFPMRNREGGIIGTYGISREITERKSMEFAIQLANDKLSIMVNWLEGRNREISVLNEMSSALEACRSSEEAYPVISREMDKLIPVDTGKLYLLNKERRLMECVASWGSEPGPVDSFLPEDCRGVQSKQIYNMAYAIQLGLSCRHLDLSSGKDLVYLCVPMLSQGEAVGLLHLRGKRKEGTETLPDLKQQLAVMASDHISLALANLTLRETLRVQSIRDSLTGLFNRRYLEESLQFELTETRERGAMLGVIMLDVDRLKQINDTFGHEAGDAVLQAVGQWLHANIRTGDISCRYGGDEFVLILPNASMDATTQRGHQICDGIRKLAFNYQGQSLGPLSVSVGVAAYPKHGESRDTLLAAVDSALYRAKEQGRDRVVIAGS